MSATRNLGLLWLINHSFIIFVISENKTERVFTAKTMYIWILMLEELISLLNYCFVMYYIYKLLESQITHIKIISNPASLGWKFVLLYINTNPPYLVLPQSRCHHHLHTLALCCWLEGPVRFQIDILSVLLIVKVKDVINAVSRCNQWWNNYRMLEY